MNWITSHLAFWIGHALDTDIGGCVVTIFAVHIQNQRQKVFGFISGIGAKC